MEKQDTLKTVIKVNRVIVGALMILFVMMSEAAPLGLFALLPLIAAVIILCGILDCPPIPVIITRLIGKTIYSAPQEEWQEINERYAKAA